MLVPLNTSDEIREVDRNRDSRITAGHWFLSRDTRTTQFSVESLFFFFRERRKRTKELSSRLLSGLPSDPTVNTSSRFDRPVSVSSVGFWGSIHRTSKGTYTSVSHIEKPGGRLGHSGGGNKREYVELLPRALCHFPFLLPPTEESRRPHQISKCDDTPIRFQGGTDVGSP